ncbi:dehydrogenase E1 component subunit alpha/beta [Compostibacter hankyongensis]|uniref:Transketolase-like pyrimidine-binding domain-containing protein n=1 Tax=Compostibacter hankyongensis TaxID=1007089 RepID=A0ABP8FBR2_9BACT
MEFDKKSLDNEALIRFYQALVFPRLVEEKMLHRLRQGKVSKWFSGIGQEAVSVGATLALQPDEWILPLHRNLGVFTTRQLPLEKLLLQWQGHPGGYSKGRERSFHFGDPDHHICGMISHLGPQLSVAAGIALAHRLRKEDKVSLVFTGDGGSSEGEFHEALNLAAVWSLPVIFLVENNGYSLSTPVSEQYRCEKLSDRAAGYGIPGLTIDGNNLLEVYHTVASAREGCLRQQRPVLLECMTFRMRGHEEASGTRYVPPELTAQWSARDPVHCYENWLESAGICPRERLNEIKAGQESRLEAAFAAAADREAIFAPDAEERDVYAPAPGNSAAGNRNNDPAPPADWVHPVSGATGRSRSGGPEQSGNETSSGAAGERPVVRGPETRFIDAVSAALQEAMLRHPNLILMGQDIADYGGVFKVTGELAAQFGKERVRNTPLCESAVIGAALGLSLEGYKSMVEMQFADFVTCGFNQIVNNLAKIHYRWGQPADVVIRLPTGAGVGAGPFHSQSNEAWFVHTPGLKVVYPAFPADAKGLLTAALEDPNPVLFFEHKALYRSVSGPVPEGYYTLPIGKACTLRPGGEACIITYGMGVHWALEYADAHPGRPVTILDLRSLLPLDTAAICQAVKDTGKVLILHEDTLTGGVGGEVAALIGEHCFEYLDAPVMRCAGPDTPVPFAPALEKRFLARSRLEGMMKKLLDY